MRDRMSVRQERGKRGWAGSADRAAKLGCTQENRDWAGRIG